MRKLAVAFAGLLPLAALAQDPPPDVFTRQNGGVYHEPPAQVDAAYLPIGPDGHATQGQAQAPLQLRLSLDFPLRGENAAKVGSNTQGAYGASPTVQALLRWHPIANAYWFAQVTFFGYLRHDLQQRWNPDFTYAFGYDDWHPDTWHLFYANYTGTRFRPNAVEGESRFNIPEGQWTLGRKFALPRALEPWLLVGDGDRSTCSANGHLMPRYDDLASGTKKSNKLSFSLGCRYERPEGWFAHFTVYGYPDRAQQQPWDPDFTYGFGYDDWRPGTVSVSYNNWSGNRFPGRERGPGEGTFRSGSITLTWKADW